MISEKDAKNKWCPLTRVYSSHGSFNSYGDGVPDSCKCRGSTCMMWHWVTEEHGYCGLSERGPAPVPHV